MQRGEVWWGRFPRPQGSRSVLLVSRTEAFGQRSMALVAPVTTRIRSIPAEVLLGPEDGMPRTCVANMDSLETVPLSLLDRRITLLGADKIQAVDDALHFALGLDNCVQFGPTPSA